MCTKIKKLKKHVFCSFPNTIGNFTKFDWDILLIIVIFDISQPAFTCSKLPIEKLEQGVNMFKVNNKDTRTAPLALLLLSLNCRLG